MKVGASQQFLQVEALVDLVLLQAVVRVRLAVRDAPGVVDRERLEHERAKGHGLLGGKAMPRLDGEDEQRLAAAAGGGVRRARFEESFLGSHRPKV
jgi:hypothetical protein